MHKWVCPELFKAHFHFRGSFFADLQVDYWSKYWIFFPFLNNSKCGYLIQQRKTAWEPSIPLCISPHNYACGVTTHYYFFGNLSSNSHAFLLLFFNWNSKRSKLNGFLIVECWTLLPRLLSVECRSSFRGTTLKKLYLKLFFSKTNKMLYKNKIINSYRGKNIHVKK